jgi:hypothetical protein
MADAEFITELCIVLADGIVNKSDKSLRLIYERNEDEYASAETRDTRLKEFLEILRGPFSPLQTTFIMKPYVLHSLFCALMLRKYRRYPRECPQGYVAEVTASKGIHMRKSRFTEGQIVGILKELKAGASQRRCVANTA